MSAAELAAIWRVPVEQVRVWAVRGNWPRTRARPYRYDPETAQEYYEKVIDSGHRAGALRRVTGSD